MTVAKPTITTVTVCRNCASTIEETVRSVLDQRYSAMEYVVVDGGSTDGTMDLLGNYSDRITKLVSESDRGVYDAMNKAVAQASGDYLIFMNAGDVFASPEVLCNAAAAADADVVYGDFAYSTGPRRGRVRADIDKGRFNHQCVMYRRDLHARFGMYFDVRGLTAADYLFFMRLRACGEVTFKKLDLVFAVVDPYGISAGRHTFLQVNLIDALLSRRGRYATAFRIAVHPIFDVLRKAGRRFL